MRVEWTCHLPWTKKWWQRWQNGIWWSGTEQGQDYLQPTWYLPTVYTKVIAGQKARLFHLADLAASGYHTSLDKSNGHTTRRYTLTCLSCVHKCIMSVTQTKTRLNSPRVMTWLLQQLPTETQAPVFPQLTTGRNNQCLNVPVSTVPITCLRDIWRQSRMEVHRSAEEFVS